MKEERLAARLKKKDDQALGEIIDLYTPLVSTIIYNVSKGTMTKEDIEEVTSDVFVTLWKNSGKIIPEKLKSYICCIAKTRAINKMATIRSNLVSIEDYDLEDDFSISDETENKDIRDELRKVINEIKEPEHEILIRYYYYYQSTSKIAKVMGINVETIKYKLRKTREKIKSMLTERGYTL